MKSSDIKRVIGKIKPDEAMEARLQAKMQQKPKRRNSLKLATAAAGLALVLCFGFYFANINGWGFGDIASGKGVTIPKIELPADGAVAGKMRPLIVYQGRIYTDSGTAVSPEAAQSLMGEKLGVTKGNLTEWSKQSDYAVEFASTIGVQEVYSVKGYDTSFRLMSYESIDGVVYAQLFECLNGLKVNSGTDLFGLLKLAGNIKAVTYENFDSWNNGLQQVKAYTDAAGMDAFLKALDASAPRAADGLSRLFEEQGADSQKFVTITLKDGTGAQLRLFKDGYVYFSGADLFFEVDKAAFDSFWDGLE